MTYSINANNITIELDEKFYSVDDIQSAYNLIKNECALTIEGGGLRLK